MDNDIGEELWAWQCQITVGGQGRWVWKAVGEGRQNGRLKDAADTAVGLCWRRVVLGEVRRQGLILSFLEMELGESVDKTGGGGERGKR